MPKRTYTMHKESESYEKTIRCISKLINNFLYFSCALTL